MLCKNKLFIYFRNSCGDLFILVNHTLLSVVQTIWTLLRTLYQAVITRRKKIPDVSPQKRLGEDLYLTTGEKNTYR